MCCSGRGEGGGRRGKEGGGGREGEGREGGRERGGREGGGGLGKTEQIIIVFKKISIFTDDP